MVHERRNTLFHLLAHFCDSYHKSSQILLEFTELLLIIASYA